MKISFRYDLQVRLVLLTILLGCGHSKIDAQEDQTNEYSQDILFKPLGIISGEKYEEELLVAIDQETQKVGLYNSMKEEILPTSYDEIYSGLVNPYYVVVVQNRLQGLFDLKGRRVCESIYSGFTFSPADSSVISAFLGDQEKWIIINDKGERIFSEAFTRIEFLRKGLVILRNEEYKCSLASTKGEFITGFEFEILEGIRTNEMNEKWYDDNDIVATAYVELKRIYINSRGELIDK